jgi:hypothetical protein
MRAVFLLMLFLVASHSATAEWMKVYGSGIQTTYANPDAIEVDGGKIKVWQLADYKRPNKYGNSPYLSVKSQTEYDCKRGLSRMLSYSLFSGKMGEGEVLKSDSSVSAWKAVSPGSADDKSWKAACLLEVGWVSVGESDDMTGYANPFSIRRKDQRVKMVELFDFKEPQIHDKDEKYLSVKHQAEYDCESNRYRTLLFSYHSENMGKGKVVFDDDNSQKWEVVVPGSIDDVLLKLACKAR